MDAEDRIRADNSSKYKDNAVGSGTALFLILFFVAEVFLSGAFRLFRKSKI